MILFHLSLFLPDRVATATGKRGVTWRCKGQFPRRAVGQKQHGCQLSRNQHLSLGAFVTSRAQIFDGPLVPEMGPSTSILPKAQSTGRSCNLMSDCPRFQIGNPRTDAAALVSSNHATITRRSKGRKAEGHSVSVALRRWGGRSGSNPRLIASAWIAE